MGCVTVHRIKSSIAINNIVTLLLHVASRVTESSAPYSVVLKDYAIALIAGPHVLETEGRSLIH